ncbi:hypothetical protein FRC01_002574 [Tulasnella sp. 417]|nr:hypothetical protein FRC01_002574 [Tulasnella sp. 417]
MLPTRGPSSTSSSQNRIYPRYSLSAFQTTHRTNTANARPSILHASNSILPPVTTHLTAHSREFMPPGMVEPAAVSPVLPESSQSNATVISNLNMGEAVVLRPRNSADAAGVSPAIQPTQPNNSHAKRERERKAKLKAEEEKRAEAEAEAKERLRKEEEEKQAKDAEDAERRRKAEEEKRKRREKEAKERAEEQERKRLEEEAEEKAEEEERERLEKEAKEALVRKREGEDLIRRENEQECRKREEAEAKAKTKEERRLHWLAEEVKARNRIRRQEEASPTGLPAVSGLPTPQQALSAPKLPVRWDSVWRIDNLDRVVYPGGIQPPSAELDNGRIMPSGKPKHVYDRDFLLQFLSVCMEKPEYASNLEGLGVERGDEIHQVNKRTGRAQGRRRGPTSTSGPLPDPSSPESTGPGLPGDPSKISRSSPLIHERNLESESHKIPSKERFRAPKRPLEQTSTVQTASSGPHPEVPPTAVHGRGDSTARERSQNQRLTSDDPVEGEHKISRRTAAEIADDLALKAILELRKHADVLLQEVKDLRGEVRELRSKAKSGDGREGSKSSQPESSVPKVPRTAKAINQYFIMKEGELDFCPGDVITILDAPKDLPRGWLYGEINDTKRGFFPGTSSDRSLLLVRTP